MLTQVIQRKRQPIVLFESLLIAEGESYRALAVQGFGSEPIISGLNPFDINVLRGQGSFDAPPGAG